MRAKALVGVIGLIAVAGLLAGCGGAQESATGQVRLMLTDQAGQIEHVWVTIREVAVHSPGAGWQTIATKDVIDGYVAQPVDLVSLRNVEKVIAAQNVATGVYNQMRLILDGTATVAIGGQTYPLNVPSGAQTGFKTSGFAVGAGQTTYLLLDIDSSKIVAPGQPGQPYVLPPTAISLAPYLGPFGSLSGAVSPASSKAVVTAYYAGTEKPAAGVSIDQISGSYLIGNLLPGQYWLGATAVGFQPYDSRPTLFAVTGGAVTDVPAITLSPAP